MRRSHQHSALKVRGHPSEQQPSHQTGDGGEDQSSTQSPGHGEVISCTRSVRRDARQVTAAAWGETQPAALHIHHHCYEVPHCIKLTWLRKLRFMTLIHIMFSSLKNKSSVMETSFLFRLLAPLLNSLKHFISGLCVSFQKVTIILLALMYVKKKLDLTHNRKTKVFLF